MFEIKFQKFVELFLQYKFALFSCKCYLVATNVKFRYCLGSYLRFKRFSSMYLEGSFIH
jgi:hypothetical protein